MPTYTFFNEETGIEYDDSMSIAEKEEFLEKNKHIKQVLQPIATVSGIGGKTHRIDDGWRDVLKSVKKASGRGNKVNVDPT